MDSGIAWDALFWERTTSPASVPPRRLARRWHESVSVRRRLALVR